MKLDADVAAALGISRSARPRQAARAVLALVGRDDQDDEPTSPEGEAWLRHLAELIGEHDWRTDDLRTVADRVADDSVSDLEAAGVPAALKIVAPGERATGPVARTALGRLLPRFCNDLITALRLAEP